MHEQKLIEVANGVPKPPQCRGQLTLTLFDNGTMNVNITGPLSELTQASKDEIVNALAASICQVANAKSQTVQVATSMPTQHPHR